jgi:hypothetical protein
MKNAKNATTNVATKALTLAELMVSTRNVTRYYVWVGDKKYDTSTEALKASGLEKEKAQKMAGKVLSLLKKAEGKPVIIDNAEWRCEARI